MTRWIATYLNILARVAPVKAQELTFKLICHPRALTLDATDLKFLNDGYEKKLDVGKRLIHYYEFGQGNQTVLLLHGWKENAARWQHLVPQLLETGYRVLALDAPGHGKNKGKHLNLHLYAQTIQALLHKEETITHAITHSFGGLALAYTLAQFRPDHRIQRIVSQGCPYNMIYTMDYTQKILPYNAHVRKLMDEKILEITGLPIQHIDIGRFTKQHGIPVFFQGGSEDRITPFPPVVSRIDTVENASHTTYPEIKHPLKSEEITSDAIHFIKQITDVLTTI